MISGIFEQFFTLLKNYRITILSQNSNPIPKNPTTAYIGSNRSLRFTEHTP